jgi:hypothetical protein
MVYTYLAQRGVSTPRGPKGEAKSRHAERKMVLSSCHRCKDIKRRYGFLLVKHNVQVTKIALEIVSHFTTRSSVIREQNAPRSRSGGAKEGKGEGGGEERGRRGDVPASFSSPSTRYYSLGNPIWEYNTR